MRLQVFLSHSGVSSRRKALAIIKSGRVAVNGKKVFEPSLPVDPSSDIVSLNGRRIFLKENVYILLNKPKGVVTTAYDKFARHTVCDLLPKLLRHLHPVGRLDKETSGLLLLTNDGDLTYRLTHPSFGVEKAYRLLLDRSLLPADKGRLQKGVFLDGKKTATCRIRAVSSREYEIILHEGRKRQIRRMFALVGYEVKELCRIREGRLALGGLAPGEWRYLNKREIRLLTL